MIRVYYFTDESMEKLLSYHTRSECRCDDPYWDYPIEELDDLVSRSTDKSPDGEYYSYNYFAYCDGRLYEIPEEILDELEEV